MAITTLPYPNMDFVPLDILTADELDHIVANYTAINNASIGTSAIANGAVTEDKIASGVIAYATGDTEQVGVKNGADEVLYMTSGMLTASNANVVFNITLPKSLKNVTRLTLTDSQVWIRHTGGGYLANNVSLASTSTVTLGKVSDNTIGVKAVKTGGWGGTNNTPVSIAGYFKISFN